VLRILQIYRAYVASHVLERHSHPKIACRLTSAHLHPDSLSISLKEVAPFLLHPICTCTPYQAVRQACLTQCCNLHSAAPSLQLPQSPHCRHVSAVQLLLLALAESLLEGPAGIAQGSSRTGRGLQGAQALLQCRLLLCMTAQRRPSPRSRQLLTYSTARRAQVSSTGDCLFRSMVILLCVSCVSRAICRSLLLLLLVYSL
jgi:hypothetical protein